MAKNKHLTSNKKFTISNLLDKQSYFKAIGLELDRDCTTISKEVRNHRVPKKTGALGRAFNNCARRRNCDCRKLCSVCKSNRYCWSCPGIPAYMGMNNQGLAVLWTYIDNGIADKVGNIVSIECFPNKVYVNRNDQYLIHTNHNVVATDEEDHTCSSTTWDRYEVMEHLVNKHLGEIDVDLAKEFLKSHERFPNSICSHPNPEKPWNKTLASMVYDLEEGKMHIAFGNACEAPYYTYQFEKY